MTSDREHEEPWWHSPFSVFQTNLQEIDATMDVDAALDVIEDYGSDTWLLNTGGIVSFYPTDLAFQTRNPYLAHRPSGDLVGDSVRAAGARGIRVIARLDLSKVSSAIAAEHPEWLFVSPTGEPQIYNSLHSVCPSADYYQRRSLDIIDEIVERYPVSGFFINWFNFNEFGYDRVYHGVCHCESCRAGFAACSDGAELPAGPQTENYWEWLAFANRTMRDLTSRIAGHLADRKPDAGLVLRKGASIAYMEASNAFGFEFWPHETAETVSAHVSASDTPLLVNCVSFVDMPYRLAGEQPERFAHYLAQAVARGGNPSTYIVGAPGRIPYPSLRLGRDVTQFHRRHSSLYTRLRPAATTAVVRPNRFGMRPPVYAESLREFRGLYSSLQQEHHPFDVLPVEALAQVGDGVLDRYELVILPDLGALGAHSAHALDSFVERGGNLLATGSSAFTEDGRAELTSSPAVRRVGEALTGAQLWSTYVTVDEQTDIAQHRYTPSIVPVFGTYARLAWAPEACPRGWVLPQAPYAPPEKCYGHTTSDDPAFGSITRGAGQTTAVPWTIGRTYSEFGTTEVRGLLMAIIQPLASPTVHAALPEQVELIVGRDDEGYVLHLLNLSGARGRSFGPPVPVHGGRIAFRDVNDDASAEALVAGQPLELESGADGTVFIDLPALERFEVVRVRAAS